MATEQREPTIILPDVTDRAAMEQWLEASRKARGLPRCRQCRRGYDPVEEAALVRRRWCYTCECNWLEPRLRKLVRRIGRRAALVALRRLTR